MDYVQPDQESFFDPSFIQQFKRSPLSFVRLHLCGNGNAGKTTLLRMLKGEYDGEDPGRTVGVEISRLELEEREFSVFDYGGQKEFHTTHDRFFEGSASVFVIVVSLVDELGELRMVEEILEEIGYWNRFVNSCCEEGEILFIIFYLIWFWFLGSERLIILSKANLVDEGIDLDEIKNSIRRDSIVLGEDNGFKFSQLLEDLQEKHERIQQVL